MLNSRKHFQNILFYKKNKACNILGTSHKIFLNHGPLNQNKGKKNKKEPKKERNKRKTNKLNRKNNIKRHRNYYFLKYISEQKNEIKESNEKNIQIKKKEIKGKKITEKIIMKITEIKYIFQKQNMLTCRRNK